MPLPDCGFSPVFYKKLTASRKEQLALVFFENTV